MNETAHAPGDGKLPEVNFFAGNRCCLRELNATHSELPALRFSQELPLDGQAINTVGFLYLEVGWWVSADSFFQLEEGIGKCMLNEVGFEDFVVASNTAWVPEL
jgi:hypothetical protein